MFMLMNILSPEKKASKASFESSLPVSVLKIRLGI